jgi:hypothetical protein
MLVPSPFIVTGYFDITALISTLLGSIVYVNLLDNYIFFNDEVYSNLTNIKLEFNYSQIKNVASYKPYLVYDIYGNYIAPLILDNSHYLMDRTLFCKFLLNEINFSNAQIQFMINKNFLYRLNLDSPEKIIKLFQNVHYNFAYDTLQLNHEYFSEINRTHNDEIFLEQMRERTPLLLELLSKHKK